MKHPIYMDHHSTTPVEPRVLESMMPFLSENYGNASSRTHSFGWDASHAVENAREQVAQLIGSTPKEIVFTSGATESIFLSSMGIGNSHGFKGHVITTSVEHKAGLDAIDALKNLGMEITVLATDSSGLVSPSQIAESLRANTVLVSVIFANNEIGFINPIKEIGALCKERNIVFHTDGTQAVGNLSVNVESLGIDLMSFSSHKIYGPKGVGALYVRRKNPRVRLKPLFSGGGQEMGLRGGTLNVPGIVGFGKACEIAHNKLSTEPKRLRDLRDRLWSQLSAVLKSHVMLNGPPLERPHRLCNNLNITFKNHKSQALLAKLHHDVALSTGSACSSETGELSHVLKAIGLNDQDALSTLRFGLGRQNTQEEIDIVAQKIISITT